jgi:acyl-coenzyme A thioesterase PaaI-like protein
VVSGGSQFQQKKTGMRGAIAERLRCWMFYFYPCYRGTGGRVKHVAADWSEVQLELPLSRRTRNYVGTIFGGSIYGAVDPIYMLMLIKRLGASYVVWDRAARIEFLKPGRTTLHARFSIPDEEIAAIRAALERERSTNRTYSVELVDGSGEVCVRVEKVIYIRKNQAASSGGGSPSSEVSISRPSSEDR